MTLQQESRKGHMKSDIGANCSLSLIFAYFSYFDDILIYGVLIIRFTDHIRLNPLLCSDETILMVRLHFKQ